MGKKPKTVMFRRKREGKTNYKKRLALLKSGKSRLSVRKSNKNITAQIIGYKVGGDVILLSVRSNNLKKYGWKLSKNNLPAAYLLGLLIGKKAVKSGIKEAILDMGMRISTKGSKIYALVKGAADSGLDVPYSEEIMPAEERIKGKHIESYAEKLKGDEKKFSKQFSGYLKNKVDVKAVEKHFEEVKKKIGGLNE